MNNLKSIKKKAINAGTWTLSGNIASQILRLVSNLVMTRLLAPEMFGVMAVAHVLIAGLNMLSDVGLNQNIIQSQRGDDPVFLNTAWVVQILRGLFISIISFVLSISLFYFQTLDFLSSDNVYSLSILPMVLMALSLCPFIRGFESTKLSVANRNLNLKQVVLLELSVQLLSISIMLIWSLNQPTIWALVAGAVSGSVLKVIFSHLFLKGMNNKLQWDKQAFNEIFHFGKWMFMSSIAGFTVSQGHKLILGALMTPTLLGVYAIAALMFGVVQGTISKLISKVIFPALGQAYRKEPERLQVVYYQIRKPVEIFCLLLSGLLMTSGSEIVDLLYDERYEQAGDMLEILSISIIMLRYSITGQCYMVIGQPKIMFFLVSSRLIFMVIFILLGYLVNQTMGIIWGIALSAFPNLFITLYFKNKFGLLNVWNEIKLLPLLVVGSGLGYILSNLIIRLDI